MKFNLVEIKNFLSVKEASVSLADRGLLLIEGVNLDDPSARSNGAGKSSVVDAISWCLYGKTARGVSADDVINRKAKKGCSVSLLIDDNGTEYRITRERKCPSSGVSIFVKKVGSDWTEITKGTVAESQEQIEKIIGCPYNVFVATVYAGQEAMPDLPAMTDKQLKELVESVIGTERLQAAYEYTLSLHSAQEAELSTARVEVIAVDNHIESLRNKVEQSKQWAEDWEQKHKIELEDLQRQINQCQSTIDERQKEYEATKILVDQTNEKLEKERAQHEKIDKIKTLLRQKERELNDEHSGVLNIEYKLNRIKQRINDLTRKATSINDIVGTACSECGKLYQAEDVADALKITNDQIAEAKQELATVQTEYDNAKANYEARKTKLESYEASIPSDDSYIEAERAVSKADSAMTSAHVMLQSEIRRKKELVERLEKAQKQTTNPYLVSGSMDEDALKEALERKQRGEKKIQEEEKRLEVINQAKQVFGKSGVRQHILDTITPVLNQRTARYLDVLSDGKLKAVWTTLTTTKKGEIKESFNIKVESSVGGGFETLSGGEKRKVRVACCLALQELVASRATKPIELFVADEVDHALDDAGVERLIGVLNEKSTVCKTLLVISHNPLRNWIDNLLKVVKKDGYSTIE